MRRPGFGTLAEAMSGFAALNGEPDGPPLLPPLALADGVAALTTAFAILVALRAREETGRQKRRAVGLAVHRGEAAHRLGERAEARARDAYGPV